jgi:hypothetical protein
LDLNLIIFILLGVPNPRADDYVNFAAEDEFLECPINKNVEDRKYDGECFNNKAKKKIDSKNPCNLASYSETQYEKIILHTAWPFDQM